MLMENAKKSGFEILEVDTQKKIDIPPTGGKPLLLYFKANPSGKRIIEILQELKAKGVQFRVARPLPRCLFAKDYPRILQEAGAPRSCSECADLFEVSEDGMTRFCGALGGRLGPKAEYLRDKEQLLDYFYSFYGQLPPPPRCTNCIHNIRKSCTAVCKERE